MTAPQNKVPALRFPEFEGEWEEKNFGSVFSFFQTNSFSRSLLNYDAGTVKNIHYGDIHTKFKSNFDITKEDVPFVNEDVDLGKIPSEYYCREGDLVIADASEDYKDVGKAIELIKLDGQKLLAGLHTYIARDKKKATVLGFKGYLMQIRYVRLQVMKMATGISVLGISKGNLSKIKLHLPSIPEQQKIAAFLTAIDTRISHLERKKTLLGQYKKGLMQRIFLQELRFKDDNGKDFPAWEEKRMGEIGTTYNGLTGKTKEDFGKGKPYINYKQIFDSSKIDISKFDFVEVGGNEKQSLAKYGDVFFTTSSETPNEVGFASVLLDDVPKLYLNSFCFGYRPKSLNLLNPKFAQYLFRSPNFRKSVYKLAQGSTRYNMSKTQLMKTKIFLPCEKEQKKIAAFLTAIDEKISLVADQIEKTRTYKKGLLQQMFV